MNRYLIKFEKKDQLRYTSHLDIMRLFKRSFKRAGVDLVYSRGFNPQPKISFAMPLSLGYESISEYMEIETQRAYQPDMIIGLVNSQLPYGIKILASREFNDDKEKLAARVGYAEYKIILDSHIVFNKDDTIKSFLKQDQIIQLKKVKKKLEKVPVDIKPLIESLDLEKNNDQYILKMLVKGGSEANLNPELLLEALFEYTSLNVSKGEYQVIRTATKDKSGKDFL